MSEFHELHGSFIRNYNFPLEADYIFSNVQELKDWEEENKVYLHKGLLKVVATQEVSYTGANDKFSITYIPIYNEDKTLTFHVNITSLDGSDITSSAIFINGKWNNIESSEFTTTEKYELQDTVSGNFTVNHNNTAVSIPFSFDVQEYIPNSSELWWVVSDSGSLTFKPLIKLDTLETVDKFKDLIDLYADFFKDADPNKIYTWKELQDLLGDPEYIVNKVKEQIVGNASIDTLEGLEQLIINLTQLLRNRQDNLQSELDNTQLGAGLNANGGFDTTYVKNAKYISGSTSITECLKILDGTIAKLHLGSIVSDITYNSENQTLLITFHANGEDQVVTVDINEIVTDQHANVVKYTPLEEGRKTIALPNNATISAIGSNDTRYNLIEVSNTADLGSSDIPINLKGQLDRPTYNNKEIALLEDFDWYEG